ncbi:MAG: CD1375 family protein [Clostridium sp.]|uniref:CD1375 family protein n=1 Tax=Clostridium sp. TaxID=1506 RepID=UPI003D6CEAB8
MLKNYLIMSYGVMIKAGRYDLEVVEGSTNKLVPATYQQAVAEYVISGTYPVAA